MRLRLTILALVLYTGLIGQNISRQNYYFKVKSSKTNETNNALNYERIEISEGLSKITFVRKVRRCSVDEVYRITDATVHKNDIMYELSKDGSTKILFLFYIDETFIIEYQGINMVLEEE